VIQLFELQDISKAAIPPYHQLMFGKCSASHQAFTLAVG
jgi:hypothetical protein